MVRQPWVQILTSPHIRCMTFDRLTSFLGSNTGIIILKFVRAKLQWTWRLKYNLACSHYFKIATMCNSTGVWSLSGLISDWSLNVILKGRSLPRSAAVVSELSLGKSLDLRLQPAVVAPAEQRHRQLTQGTGTQLHEAARGQGHPLILPGPALQVWGLSTQYRHVPFTQNEV